MEIGAQMQPKNGGGGCVAEGPRLDLPVTRGRAIPDLKRTSRLRTDIHVQAGWCCCGEGRLATVQLMNYPDTKLSIPSDLSRYNPSAPPT